MRALDALDGRPRPGDARVPATRARSCSTTATTSGPRRTRPASTNAFDYPGFVPAFIRPQFCEGRGPFRWVALSGDPEDIAAPTRRSSSCSRDDTGLRRWLELAEAKVPFQGLPARICWLGYGERARAGLAFNELVASGRGEGADRHRARPPRLRLGRLAEPRDGGDARRLRRDRRLAAAQRARQHGGGATWVSIHHGGGVGIGYSQHAGHGRRRGRDGARGPEARAGPDDRPRDGRVRHVDAGYEHAIEVARERGVHIPMLDG